MRTNLAILGTGLVTAHLLGGCVPFGCGAPSDPTNVPTYALTLQSTAVAPAEVDGIAAEPDGVWLLETAADGGHALVEYDRPGGVEHRRIALGGDPVFGLAADGAALWYGRQHGDVSLADRIDLATGAQIAEGALPHGSVDLAWDGTYVVAVQGMGAIEHVDPATSAVEASVPVQQLSAVTTVAVDGYETWVAQPGSTALVYGSDGVLAAKVSSDAFSAPSHIAFVGDQLAVAQGTSIDLYAIDRPVTR